jgi:hypothetical protein
LKEFERLHLRGCDEQQARPAPERHESRDNLVRRFWNRLLGP